MKKMTLAVCVVLAVAAVIAVFGTVEVVEAGSPWISFLGD